MNEQNLFEFKSYKSYLRALFGGTQVRNGARKKAAESIGCHTAYLSLVLNGDANLNLEQAQKLSTYLGHDTEAEDFFLLLVQLERAGTRELSNYFQNKIEQHLSERQSIRGRLKSKESISVEDQVIYYSKWHYSCVHVLISIPGLQTKAAIAAHLSLPLSLVSEILDFLESRGLALEKNGEYQIGPRHLHLSAESPNINKHHVNWRSKAQQAMDAPKKDDLHYSVVYSMSREDSLRIKHKIMDLIQSNMAIVKDSKEEQAVAFTMDYFEI